jgi:hypothetical protein
MFASPSNVSAHRRSAAPPQTLTCQVTANSDHRVSGGRQAAPFPMEGPIVTARGSILVSVLDIGAITGAVEPLGYP